jgi:metallo-beta-lactamase family protein
MSSNIKLKFLGGVGTVTGSKHLLEVNDKKILIDCGLFQGLKELRLRNWDNLPIDASQIHCVILTHGHLDHVGYLPLLFKQGFKGPIYASVPTLEIAKLILVDSARIQEEDAERANELKYSKHKPAKPLYTVQEAEGVFEYFDPKELDVWIDLFPGVSFKFKYNGHIAGATFIEMKVNDKRIVFSGDVGRTSDPLLRDPDKPTQTDFMVLESTYGNRLHPPNVKENLAKLINEAVKRNGPIVIPSFAVERSQLIMYHLWQLRIEGKIPHLPVYLDIPMGESVLSIFKHNPQWHKLSEENLNAMLKQVHVVKKQKESLRLAQDKAHKIVIAASGMASGGRVLSYFEFLLGDPSATILLAGYQGEGTRGRALLDGAKEIKLRGKLFFVKATIASVEGLSAHADQAELIEWISRLDHPPKNIFIVHGEKTGAAGLSKKINEVYHYNCVIPKLNEEFDLDQFAP